MGLIEKMLAAQEAAVPKSGFNVVQVDDMPMDPEDQLTVVGNFEKKSEALAELSKRERANPGLKYYVYASK